MNKIQLSEIQDAAGAASGGGAGVASSAPRLAPPGAGLPGPELFVARLLFRWHRMRATRASAAALIEREREEVLRLAGSLGTAEGARRVLIRRLPGLEDSSRDWSVYMTLEHLRIVNEAVAGAITLLGRGKAPERAASTAAVKPAAGIGREVLAGFAASCARVCAAAEGVADLRTATRYAHPWFGPLDAAGWLAMAGFHLRLHRRQVERIRMGVGGGGGRS